jgi:hypothetical protein
MSFISVLDGIDPVCRLIVSREEYEDMTPDDKNTYNSEPTVVHCLLVHEETDEHLRERLKP